MMAKETAESAPSRPDPDRERLIFRASPRGVGTVSDIRGEPARCRSGGLRGDFFPKVYSGKSRFLMGRSGIGNI